MKKPKTEKKELTKEERQRYEAEVWNNAYNYHTGKYDMKYIKSMGVRLPKLK